MPAILLLGLGVFEGGFIGFLLEKFRTFCIKEKSTFVDVLEGVGTIAGVEMNSNKGKILSCDDGNGSLDELMLVV